MTKKTVISKSMNKAAKRSYAIKMKNSYGISGSDRDDVVNYGN